MSDGFERDASHDGRRRSSSSPRLEVVPSSSSSSTHSAGIVVSSSKARRSVVGRIEVSSVSRRSRLAGVASEGSSAGVNKKNERKVSSRAIFRY